jgi:hypothetical protein
METKTVYVVQQWECSQWTDYNSHVSLDTAMAAFKGYQKEFSDYYWRLVERTEKVLADNMAT